MMIRNALGFGQSARGGRLTPRLPRSVGLAPVFPAQGRFGHGAVHAQPTSVQPIQFVIAFQSHPPQLQEYPRGPIPGSADGRLSRNRCPWHPGPSTGSQYAARRRCHWCRCGREPEAGRRRTGGCSRAEGSTAPALPKARRRSEMNQWWGWFSWRGQPASDAAGWGLSLWSLPQPGRYSNLDSHNGLASFGRLLG